MICNACPRRCGADRAVSTGRCKTKEAFSVARIALHFWEEPPLSGTRGSGAVFFFGLQSQLRILSELRHFVVGQGRNLFRRAAFGQAVRA